jgi:hypothetical protein
MLPFEQDNLKAYTLLLRIEVAIRECLRKHLESSIGLSWHKHLPGDLLKKIREAQKEEYRPQFNFRRMGPLYYLTLGELLPILEQKLGKPVADRFGGTCFTKQLENVLGPRNALSHGRDVTTAGLKAIDALYAQVEASLTPVGLDALLSTPDVGLSPSEACSAILPSLRQALTQITSLPVSLPIDSGVQSLPNATSKPPQSHILGIR